MTLTHLPTKASVISNQTFGFVSGAEGFIFLAAFMVAGFMLLVGIVIMMLQNFRETREVAQEPAERPLQVYRQTPCPLDATIYERLVETANALEETPLNRGACFPLRSPYSSCQAIRSALVQTVSRGCSQA